MDDEHVVFVGGNTGVFHSSGGLNVEKYLERFLTFLCFSVPPRGYRVVLQFSLWQWNYRSLNSY